MKRSVILSAAILLQCALFTNIATAQQRSADNPYPRNHYWSVQLMYNQLKTLDQNISGLIYTGNLPVIGIAHQTQSRKGVFTTSLQMGTGAFFPKNFPDRSIVFLEEDPYGQIDTVMVPMRGTSTLGRLDLKYMYRFNPGNQLEWTLGGAIGEHFHYQDGFVEPALMNVLAFSPAIQLKWQVTPGTFFTSGISTQVLAVVSRSAYHNSVSAPGNSRIKGFLSQGTRLESMDTHGQLEFQAGMFSKLGERIQAGVQYDFRLLSNKHPRPVNLVQNQIGISIRFLY